MEKNTGPMLQDQHPSDSEGNATTTSPVPKQERRLSMSNPPRREVSHPSGIMGFFSRMGDLPEWHVRGKHLSGKALNYSIGFIASCGFLMFGYDQGVLSALLTLDDFQKDIPLMTPYEASNRVCFLDDEMTQRDPAMCTGDPNTQAAGVAIYQIGCFLGAVLILFYGETWGRKSSTFWGSLIMIIGTIMQGSAHEYGLFAAGRIVGGVGNGMVTSSKPFPSRSSGEELQLTDQ
jgi:hypothetical protein